MQELKKTSYQNLFISKNLLQHKPIVEWTRNSLVPLRTAHIPHKIQIHNIKKKIGDNREILGKYIYMITWKRKQRL